MTTIEHSVVIAQPLDNVWAYLANPANNPIWQGPVTEVRPGTPLAVTMGGRRWPRKVSP